MRSVQLKVLPKLSKDSLYNAFRDELLAMNLRRMATGGVLVTTPASAWQYYDKFNRRVTAEFVPFEVDDYISQVSGEPTKTEISDLYEKYKDAYPSPRSEDPGFKRPPHVKFGYVMVDFNKLVEEEKANVTREQMEDHYEKNKDNYRRPVIDEPDSTTEPSDDSGEATTDDGESTEDDSSETPGTEDSDASAAERSRRNHDA